MLKTIKWQQIVFMNLKQWYFDTLFSADVGDCILLAFFLLAIAFSRHGFARFGIAWYGTPFSKGLLRVPQKWRPRFVQQWCVVQVLQSRHQRVKIIHVLVSSFKLPYKYLELCLSEHSCKGLHYFWWQDLITIQKSEFHF